MHCDEGGLLREVRGVVRSDRMADREMGSGSRYLFGGPEPRCPLLSRGAAGRYSDCAGLG